MQLTTLYFTSMHQLKTVYCSKVCDKGKKEKNIIRMIITRILYKMFLYDIILKV